MLCFHHKSHSMTITLKLNTSRSHWAWEALKKHGEVDRYRGHANYKTDSLKEKITFSFKMNDDFDVWLKDRPTCACSAFPSVLHCLQCAADLSFLTGKTKEFHPTVKITVDKYRPFLLMHFRNNTLVSLLPGNKQVGVKRRTTNPHLGSHWSLRVLEWSNS